MLIISITKLVRIRSSFAVIYNALAQHFLRLILFRSIINGIHAAAKKRKIFLKLGAVLRRKKY